MDYFWILTSTTSHPNSSPMLSTLVFFFSSSSVELYIIRFSPMRYLKDYFHSSGWFWPTFVLVLLRPTMVSLYFLCRSYIQVYHKQINDDIKTWLWRADRREILNKVLHHNLPSLLQSPQNASLVWPWHSNKHCFVLVHLIFCTTYYLSSHFEDDNHPAWLSKRILVDAQSTSAHRSLQDIYTKNVSSFQWQWRRKDIASYQWNCVRCDSWKKFLWPWYVSV